MTQQLVSGPSAGCRIPVSLGLAMGGMWSDELFKLLPYVITLAVTYPAIHLPGQSINQFVWDKCTAAFNISVPIWVSQIVEQDCSENGYNAESKLCLGHTGEMRSQCTFTVKRSTSEARRAGRAGRAKLTGSKLIKKYKQAELVKIVKLGELSL